MMRVAIIGAGIGAQHLEGYLALPDAWEVSLIVDLNSNRARAIAKDIPVVRDISVALLDPAIDVIDICLPPHLHVPVTLQALAASKHVICEKPLTTSMADIDRLRVAKKTAQREVFPVFQYRFGTAFAALDALRAADLLGKPILAAAETHWARDAVYYAVPWRGTWAGEQGGAIVTHAIHAHDLISHHMGPIKTVSATLATRANPIETEDTAGLVFELENGALATSSITLGAAQDETRLRFVYENLTATSGNNPYAPAQEQWTFEARNPVDQAKIDRVVHAASARGGFAGAFDAIAAALMGAPGKAVGFEDAARSIDLIAASYHAARTGQKVALPILRTHPLYSGWQP